MLESKNFDLKDKIGDYMLLKQINKGTFGIVGLYKGQNNKKIAIKVCQDSGEAEVMPTENVTGIVSKMFKIDLGENNLIAIGMEVSECDTLFMRKNIFLTKEHHLKFIFEIASGLFWLHQNQICHTDLKLNNTLYFKEINEFQICDFGLACKEGTIRDQALFNPPPEVKTYRDIKISKEIDIWAFGCTIFELCFGYRFPNFEITQKITEMMIKKIGGFITGIIIGTLKPDPNERMKIDALVNKFAILASGCKKFRPLERKYQLKKTKTIAK